MSDELTIIKERVTRLRRIHLKAVASFNAFEQLKEFRAPNLIGKELAKKHAEAIGTYLRVNRGKSRVHYFGALNVASKKEELIKLDWQNTDNIIEALREIGKRYKEKKLCIVWDNARWHRSKQLKELLGKGKEFEHLHFIWLPPYAPDHNPQERVWRIAKDTTANTVTQTFHELQDIFEQAIAGKRFDYKMSGI